MGKVAYVFAGQGAQHVGMGRDLYEKIPAARACLDRAEALRPGTLSLCFEGPIEVLSRTSNTQPCLFAVDMACAAAAREAGVAADMAAGFSLGEVAALCDCGYLDFDAAFRLVMRRAEWMDAAAERYPGKMAAVLRLSADEVTALAAQFDGVYPVNFNCPGQTVVAAKAESFDAFCEAVKQRKGRAMPLNVSGAFHSPFMDEAQASMAEYLKDMAGNVPSLPLYANLTGEPYPDDWRGTLAMQINHPVRWEHTIRNMALAGATTFIELGAGATLGGLIRKIVPDATILTVQNLEGMA